MSENSDISAVLCLVGEPADVAATLRPDLISLRADIVGTVWNSVDPDPRAPEAT